VGVATSFRGRSCALAAPEQQSPADLIWLKIRLDAQRRQAVPQRPRSAKARGSGCGSI